MGHPSLAATANAAVSTAPSLRMQQKTSKSFPVIVVVFRGTAQAACPRRAAWSGSREGSGMTTATRHATRTRSVIRKFPGGGFGSHHSGPPALRKLSLACGWSSWRRRQPGAQKGLICAQPPGQQTRQSAARNRRRGRWRLRCRRSRRRHARRPLPASAPGECVAFAQIGQHEQGLPPGVEPAPARPGLPAVTADDPGT
jgi:hypothetical protein